MRQVKKAIAALVASAVVLAGAAAAYGWIDNETVDTVAKVVAALTPILTALGVYVAPANETS